LSDEYECLTVELPKLLLARK